MLDLLLLAATGVGVAACSVFNTTGEGVRVGVTSLDK